MTAGDTNSRYRIAAPLGCGGMGDAYRAELDKPRLVNEAHSALIAIL